MNQATRLKVFVRSKWRCEVCGLPLHHHKAIKQIAHIIKAKYKKKYGEEVIDHPFNLKAVCCVSPCNNKVDLGVKVGLINELLKRIYDDLGYAEEDRIYEKM